MGACNAQEAQLRLPLGRDDVHRCGDRVACLAYECLAIRGLTNSLRRAGDQPLVVVCLSFGNHGAEGPDGGVAKRRVAKAIVRSP